MTEAELASAVSAWLRADGWRTYHEVPMGDGRADIVAVRGGALVWVVETKLRGGIDVLHQALDRRAHGASGVLVAVPRAKGRAFRRVAGQLGIGVIEVAGAGFIEGVQLAAWPEYHRHADALALVSRLVPEQERQVAGLGGSSYWTPFKRFVREFVEHMARSSGPRSLSEASSHRSIKIYKPHHAEPQLRRYLVWAIEKGLVPGVRLEGAGRVRMVVYDGAAITADQRREYHLAS